MRRLKHKYYIAYNYKSDKGNGSGCMDILFRSICSIEEIKFLERIIKNRLEHAGKASWDVSVVILNWRRYDRRRRK
jgi:hypothetical protein